MDTKEFEFGPAERRVLKALKRLEPPQASDASRERARRAFLHGESGAALRRSVARALAVWVPLAAAAAIVLLLLYGSMSIEHWQITDIVGPEGVRIEGVELALGSRVDGGSVATGPGSELGLQLGESLNLRLLEGTEIELPAAPGRWLGRTRRLELSAGEVCGTTVKPSLGFTLYLSTPEAEAELTGTTFAVFRLEDSTCFCLYEGRMLIHIPGLAAPVEMPIERRIFIYKDGRPYSIEALTPREQMKLQMMDDAGVPPLAEPGD